VRVHLDGLDPLTDEPSLRLLTWLEERQRLHVEELPPPLEPPARGPEDAGALPILLREVRPLAVMAPLGDPARDAFVEVREGGDPYLAREWVDHRKTYGGRLAILDAAGEAIQAGSAAP